MPTTTTQSPLYVWPKFLLSHGTNKVALLACHGTWPMCCLPQSRGLQEVRLRSGMVLQPSLPEARLGLFRRTSPGSLPAASIQRHLQFSQRPQQSARSHSVFHHQVSSQGSPVNEMIGNSRVGVSRKSHNHPWPIHRQHRHSPNRCSSSCPWLGWNYDYGCMINLSVGNTCMTL
jgi:hypothetical protein